MESAALAESAARAEALAIAEPVAHAESIAPVDWRVSYYRLRWKRHDPNPQGALQEEQKPQPGEYITNVTQQNMQVGFLGDHSPTPLAEFN